MKATSVIIHNPLYPAAARDILQIKQPTTLQSWVDANKKLLPGGKPFLCILNGEPVLRERWSEQTIRHGDVVIWLILPRGGKASNVFKIILGVVIVAVSAFYGNVPGMLAGVGMIAGGAMGLAMVPDLPSPMRQRELAEPSPVYSIGAQGNSARLGQAIPDVYGRHIVYPDFAAQPYTEYAGNDMYLYELLCIGLGEYDVESIRVADTPIDNFEEIDYEIIPPGQKVTLFPTNVYSNVEVAGQELLTGQPAGPFTANGSGTTINRVAFDLVCPKGLYYANDEGGIDSRSVNVLFEVREIDDDGNAIGSWQALGTETITAASNTPIRRTYHYDLATARYEARATRQDSKDTSIRAGHDVMWAGLRGYIPGDQVNNNVTLLAVRMRATNNLSNQASRQINCIVTRKLPVWDKPTQSWTTPAPTRSPAWALANIARAQWGGNVADNRINLDALYDLAQIWETRGDYFDGVFDSRMSLFEALQSVASVGRGIVFLQAGILSVVRDQPSSMPTAMFSPFNIVKQSFQIEYIVPTDDTPDYFEIEYFDKDYWTWRTVACKFQDSTTLRPVRRKIFGITGRDQAWREGIFKAACNRWRRVKATWDTELEGHIPTLGDMIALSHDMPGWGQSGEVVAWDAETRTVTCSEPLDWSAGGTFYMALRRKDGSWSGNYVATQGADEYQAVLDTDPDFTPYTGQEEVRTLYQFGGENKRDFKILAIQPGDDNTVTLVAMGEDARVYQADQTEIIPPDLGQWPLPVIPDVPEIRDLRVVRSGTVFGPRLSLSWTPAPGADHYLIEFAEDQDNPEWTTAGITSNSHYTLSVNPGHIWLRVAAVGVARGPWVYWDGNVDQIPPPGDVQNLHFSDPSEGSFYTIEWDAAARASWYVVQVVVPTGDKTLDDFVGQALDTVKGKTLLEVLAVSGLVVREIETTSTSYTYTAEQMALDGGPWRQVTFKVKAINSTGQSANWALLVGGNEPPAAVSNVRLYRQSLACIVSFYLPPDIDLAGVVIAVSQTHGFTPTITDIVWEGLTTIATISSMPDGSPFEEGTVYYIRIGTYDAFGKDSITWTDAEYSFTAESLVDNAGDVLSKVRDALLDDTTRDEYGDFLFHSHRFGVVIPTGEGNKEKVIFGLTNVDGTDYVVLNADVIVGGDLSISNLRDGYLPTDVTFGVGDGSVVIDGGGAGNASISVYDGPEGNPNRDYALLSAGDITFFRFIAGAYRNYKSLRRREYGTAVGNTTVTIPGYWSSPPSVIPFPTGLMAYNSDYADQDQSIWIDAQNVRAHPTDEGKYIFDCIAKWMLGSNNGTNTVNSAYQTADEVWTSGSSALPTNTSSVNVKVSFKSRKGTGNHTHEYYYRQVRVRVQTSSDNVTFYNRTDDVFEIGAQINTIINKVIKLDIPPGDQFLRVYFEASNAGGTFTLGPDEYTYDTWQGTPTAEKTVYSDIDCVNFQHDIANLSSWPAPAGAEITNIDYHYEIAFYITNPSAYPDCTTSPQAYTSHGWSAGSNRASTAKDYKAVTYHTGPNVNYNPTIDMYVRAYSTYSDGGWNPDEHYPNALSLRNAYAVIRYRELVKNSTEASNWFSFDSFDWQIPAGEVPIENGSISYIAIGD